MGSGAASGPRGNATREERRARLCLQRLCALAALLAGTGCSLLVEPDERVARCVIVEVSGDRCPGDAADGAACLFDPCSEVEPPVEDGLSPLHCRGMVCQPCDPKAERCNGVDDNCNGFVDEDLEANEICDGVDNDCDGKIDEGQDMDGDGYNYCGGGNRDFADCVDSDPAILPPAAYAEGEPTEVCDGKDNDCNGFVDDAPECEDGTDCMPGSCPDGQTCDTTTGRCVVPLPLGSTCSRDTECEGGICIRAEALGLSNVGESICGQACCTDGDCAPGVCYAPGTGARSCLPASFVGSEGPGARCERNAECASGVCDDRQCQTVCTRDADCAEGACVFRETTGTFLLESTGQFVCGPAQPGAEQGSFCNVFTGECASGFCLERNFVGQCAAPCGRTSDCGAGYCTHVETAAYGETTRAAVCSTAPSGDGSQGDACDDDADCRDGYCIDAACADTCCKDVDCSDSARRCRPHARGGAWQMLCLP